MTVLRETRLKNKLTLKQLANKAHITLSYLSQLETGVRSNPSLPILNSLAKELNISVLELVESFKAM